MQCNLFRQHRTTLTFVLMSTTGLHCGVCGKLDDVKCECYDWQKFIFVYNKPIRHLSDPI